MGVVSRAKRLHTGEASAVAEEDDTDIVQALREIAGGKIKVDLEADIRRSLEVDEALTGGLSSIATAEPGAGEPDTAG